MAQLPKNRDDTHGNLTSVGSYVSIYTREWVSSAETWSESPYQGQSASCISPESQNHWRRILNSIEHLPPLL